MHLQCVMIFVADLERMTAFYRDVVGLEIDESMRRADCVPFKSTGAGLALHAIPSQISDPKAHSPLVAREQQALKFIFFTDDPAKELARLESLGVAIIRRPWGGWDFLDPEGNVVGVQFTSS